MAATTWRRPTERRAATRAVGPRRVRKGIHSALCLGLVLTGATCGSTERQPGLEAISEPALEAHTRFLAGDLLEGRAPGTDGSRLAASYIAAQFEISGLQPLADDSSFLAPIELRVAEPEGRIGFRAPGGAQYSPEPGEELLLWSGRVGDSARIQGDLVFVGYGIHAPELGWDDYKGSELDGKVLLLLSGEPDAAAPGPFRGDTLTYYGVDRYKLAEAARRGAAAAVLLPAPEPTDGAWTWGGAGRSEQYGGPAVEWAPAAPPLVAWMDASASEQVIAMAGLHFETLLELAASEKFRPLATSLTASGWVRGEARDIVDFNVAGWLPGRDADRSDEVVVFTAHYDHLGRGPPEGADSIYNGAYASASGVATLLVLADAFARLPQRPRRSMVFLALTAEEHGRLGSLTYTRAPLVPLERTVAAIELGPANLWGPTSDVVVLGADDPGLRGPARRAARAEELALAGDPFPAGDRVYRSSAFSFAAADVPALLVTHGVDYVGRLPGWGRQNLTRYVEERVRRPGDELQSGMDFRGAVQQARVAFRLGLALANVAERPAGSAWPFPWMPSDSPARVQRWTE